MTEKDLRPAGIVWLLWIEQVAVEEDAEILEPVYLEAA
jgi:hypothetical protein